MEMRTSICASIHASVCACAQGWRLPRLTSKTIDVSHFLLFFFFLSLELDELSIHALDCHRYGVDLIDQLVGILYILRRRLHIICGE